MLKQVASVIWDFILEWDLIPIFFFFLCVKYQHRIIEFLFANIGDDLKLLPDLESFGYWFQSATLFFLSTSIIWLYTKKSYKDESLDHQLKIAAVILFAFVFFCQAVFQLS